MTQEPETTLINGKQVNILDSHKSNPSYRTQKQQVFIVGSKGIPAAYGGFETFVENLTRYQQSDGIRYHVSRLAHDDRRYEYNRAKCFNVEVADVGAGRSVFYDLKALRQCIEYCRQRPSIKHPVFYVLACRIGPFIGHYKKQIRKLGGVLYVNPDGHEWMRSKWSLPVRRYWKWSERLMVKHSDLVICDSVNIEKYIREEYAKYKPQTKYISYGSDTRISSVSDDDPAYTEWMKKHNITPMDYYLVVCRLVPENNFETIIREFMKSDTMKKLVIVATKNRNFGRKLRRTLQYEKDPRIRFVGTVYDSELLKKIRENAYAYIHGHEVGGTNPSLLEALQCTKLNLLYQVGFNEEVAKDSARYWTKESGNLARLIHEADRMPDEVRETLSVKAKARIDQAYRWKDIVDRYETLFMNTGDGIGEDSDDSQLS